MDFLRLSSKTLFCQKKCDLFSSVNCLAFTLLVVVPCLQVSPRSRRRTNKHPKLRLQPPPPPPPSHLPTFNKADYTTKQLNHYQQLYGYLCRGNRKISSSPPLRVAETRRSRRSPMVKHRTTFSWESMRSSTSPSTFP